MEICRFYDYVIYDYDKKRSLEIKDLTISKGSVYSIQTDSKQDAIIFLKALATLVKPEKGFYYFSGRKLNFSSYKKLLSVKKNIGYIASDSALLSNKSLRDNLLFMHMYFENSKNLSINKYTKKLCDILNITNKLDLRCAEVDFMTLRSVIAIREIVKKPVLMLMECPENFIAHNFFKEFIDIFEKEINKNTTSVFLSYNKKFINKFSNNQISILNGKIQIKE
jgi:ABC-type ATPase involved in cell division